MFLQTEKSELVNKVSDSRSEEVMDNNNVSIYPKKKISNLTLNN